MGSTEFFNKQGLGPDGKLFSAFQRFEDLNQESNRRNAEEAGAKKMAIRDVANSAPFRLRILWKSGDKVINFGKWAQTPWLNWCEREWHNRKAKTNS